jgi:hypothetical protein
MSIDEKALSFVGAIMTAYNAAEKAGASALSYALDCGKHLNLAKENVEAVKKGKWKQWREKNLPSVSEETERLYRRLADAVAAKENIFANCKSIRAAMQRLSMYEFDDEGNLQLKPDPQPKSNAKGTGNGVTGLEPPEADTPSTGLKAELENAAADDVSIKDDADKLEEIAKASIARLTPDKVCVALTKAWDASQLRDLVRHVNAYLIGEYHEIIASLPPPAVAQEGEVEVIARRASPRPASTSSADHPAERAALVPKISPLGRARRPTFQRRV